MSTTPLRHPEVGLPEESSLLLGLVGTIARPSVFRWILFPKALAQCQEPTALYLIRLLPLHLSYLLCPFVCRSRLHPMVDCLVFTHHTCDKTRSLLLGRLAHPLAQEFMATTLNPRDVRRDSRMRLIPEYVSIVHFALCALTSPQDAPPVRSSRWGDAVPPEPKGSGTNNIPIGGAKRLTPPVLSAHSPVTERIPARHIPEPMRAVSDFISCHFSTNT